MIDSKKGSVSVGTNFRDMTVRIVFEGYDMNGDTIDICAMDERSLKNFIYELEYAKRKLEAERNRKKKLMSEIDFAGLYAQFERKYNPYPTQMSRAEAFGLAYKDGLIDKETYDLAHEYYERLWFYVGD